MCMWHISTGLDWTRILALAFFAQVAPQLVGHHPPVHHPCCPFKYAYLLYRFPKALQSCVESAMDDGTSAVGSLPLD